MVAMEDRTLGSVGLWPDLVLLSLCFCCFMCEVSMVVFLAQNEVTAQSVPAGESSIQRSSSSPQVQLMLDFWEQGGQCFTPQCSVRGEMGEVLKWAARWTCWHSPLAPVKMIGEGREASSELGRASYWEQSSSTSPSRHILINQLLYQNPDV